MYRHRIRRRGERQFGLKPVFLPRNLLHLCNEMPSTFRAQFESRLQQLLELPSRLRQLPRQLRLPPHPVRRKPPPLLGICRDGGLDRLRAQKPGPHDSDHTLFDLTHAHCAAVLACARILPRRAAQIIVAADNETSTATAAAKQTRKHALGSAAMMKMRTAPAGPKRLHFRPDIFVDDAKLRHVTALPLALRVRPRDALACHRILQKALTVVNDRPAIQFVIQQPILPLRRA